MTRTTRRRASAALLSLLTSAADWATVSTKLRLWKDLDKDRQPALFLVRKDLGGKSLQGGDRAREATYLAYIYVRDTGPGGPGEALDDLIDAVETALEAAPDDGCQTLGGLVRDCRISGIIETDEGTLGDQAVAWIPITLFID